MNDRQKWQAVKTTMLVTSGVCGVTGGGIAYRFWGLSGSLALIGTLLCLALGFWITEMLIGVFTATKRANGTAVALLFAGKIAWWTALFFGIRFLPDGVQGAVGLGVGIFLLSLLVAGLRHYGMPRISDGNPPDDP